MPLRLGLEGKHVVITGASRGIGKAIAFRFAAEGAQVLISARGIENLASCLDELRQTRPACLALAADVTSERDVRQLADYACEQMGEVDILVNNAGMYPVTPFMELTLEEWRSVIQTNLDGPFLCSKVFGQSMIARRTRGRILNIGSTSSRIARPGIAHYASSKAGLNMLTRVLALEMAPYGITVNALCPGVIETENVLGHAADPRHRAEHDAKLKRIPLGRLGRPEEVAAAALFMVSDEAEYLTGACLILDGGYTLGIPSYGQGAKEGANW